MENHPIEGLMNTAMSNLKDMIDVNTVVGDAIDCGNGTTIIPVSRVCFGFAAGGSEFKGETIDQYSKEGIDEDITYKLPFGGGSGARSKHNADWLFCFIRKWSKDVAGKSLFINR